MSWHGGRNPRTFWVSEGTKAEDAPTPERPQWLQVDHMLSSGAPSGIGRHALFISSTTVPRLWHKRNFAVSATPMVADKRGLLTGTYDSSTKTGTLDLDGQQVGSSNAGANTVDPSYQPAAIPGRFYYRLRVTLIP